MKKWLKNFWYYYKVPVIIAFVILAVGIYFLSQRRSVKSDYDAAVVSARGCSDEQLARLRSVLEQAGRDQTGDGIVTVKIHVYRFAIGTDGQDREAIAGLDADLVGKVSGLFFVDDPEQFEESTNGIGKASDAFPVSDISQLKEYGIDSLYLLVRKDMDEKYDVLKTVLAE